MLGGAKMLNLKGLDERLEKFSFQPHCHICGNETEYDWVCDKCGEHFCEDCQTPFTYHNQIDYPLCKKCYDIFYD